MGLLKTILERDPTTPAPPAADSAPPPADSVPGPPTVDRPGRCPTCSGEVFWLDVYQGLHCAACDPLPDSGRLVKAMLELGGTTDRPAWLKLGASIGMDGAAGNRRGIHPDPDELVEFEILATTGRVLRFLAIDDRRCPPDRVAKVAVDDEGYAIQARTFHGPNIPLLPRYDPPLAAGPVGDLTLDEWFDMLPEWRAGAPAKPMATR